MTSADPLETLKSIAEILYKHNCWNELPWGVKQQLLQYVSKETLENWGKKE